MIDLDLDAINIPNDPNNQFLIDEGDDNPIGGALTATGIWNDSDIWDDNLLWRD